MDETYPTASKPETSASKPAARLELTLDAQGNLAVAGEVPSTLVAFGMLEIAKANLLQRELTRQARQPQRRVLPADPALDAGLRRLLNGKG